MLIGKIQCRFRHHSEITAICLHKNCQLRRLCCVECINEFHKDHLDNLIQIDSMNSFIQQESRSQNSCFNPYSQLLERLNELSYLIEMLKQTTKEQIEKNQQYSLQNYILEQCNNQGTIEEWNRFIEGLLLFVEIDKNVLKQKIQCQLSQKEEKQLEIVREVNKAIENTVNSLKNPVFQKQLEFERAHYILRGHQDLVNGVGISQNGTIASGSTDKSVRLWDVKKKGFIRKFQNEEEVQTLSMNDQYLAFAGKQIFSIQLYDLKQNLKCEPLIGHKDKIRSLAFSVDSQFLFSGGIDKQVIVWDLTNKKPIFNIESDQVIQKVIGSLENQFLSFICSDSLQIWDLQDKIKLIHQEKPHSPGFGVCCTKDSQTFVTCGDGSIKIWKFNYLGKASLTLIQSIKEAYNLISDVILSSDEQYILSLCYKEGRIMIHDLESGTLIQELKFLKTFQQLDYHPLYRLIGQIALSNDMKFLILNGPEHDILIWERK